MEANEPSTPALILICLAPLLFAAFWCGVVYLLSHLGGWAQLALKFRAHDLPNGQRFGWQSARIGRTRYNNALTIFTSKQGLYLQPFILFRLAHPPLLIPWSEVKHPQVQRLFMRDIVLFDVGSPTVATLHVPRKVFEAEEAGAKMISAPLTPTT
jgi:hypothetical protein